MSTNKEKRLTMRQQVRIKAEAELVNIKHKAIMAVGQIAVEAGIDMEGLAKVISEGSHKTTEHQLVTQLANKYEDDLVKLWNDQQTLPLGEKK